MHVKPRSIIHKNFKVAKPASGSRLPISYYSQFKLKRLLYFRGLFNFKPSLNLGETSMLTKQQLLRDCFKDEQEIRVMVLRAHNLLNRAPGVDSDQNLDDYIGGIFYFF